MSSSLLAVFTGAGLGALLRWYFNTKLNTLYPALPLGTLSANLLGGYLIGLAIAFFTHNTTLSPEWKLFIITGFLGGLTTFSTFSAEIVTAITQGRIIVATATIGLHVIGSILMTFMGIATYNFFLFKGNS